MKNKNKKTKHAPTKKTVRRISILLLLLAIAMALATLLVDGGLKYIFGGISLTAFAGASRVFAGSARYWISGGFALGAAAVGVSGAAASNPLLLFLYWTLLTGAGLFAFSAFLPWRLAVALLSGIAIGSMYFSGVSLPGGQHLWGLLALLFLIWIAMSSGWMFWLAFIMNIIFIIVIVIQVFNPLNVTFNANGGTFADNTATQVVRVKYGTNLADVEVENPTRPGYSFDKWNATGVVIYNARVRAIWAPLEPVVSIQGSTIGIVGVESDYTLQIANVELLGEHEVQWYVYDGEILDTYSTDTFTFEPGATGEYTIWAHVITSAGAATASNEIAVEVYAQIPALNIMPPSSLMEFGVEYGFFINIPNYEHVYQNADVVLSIYKRGVPGNVVHSQSAPISNNTILMEFMPVPYGEITPGEYTAEITTTAGGRWTMDITIDWFSSPVVYISRESGQGPYTGIIEMHREDLESTGNFFVYLFGDSSQNMNYYASVLDLRLFINYVEVDGNFIKSNINHTSRTADITFSYTPVLADIPAHAPYDIAIIVKCAPTSAESQTGVVIRIID